MIEKIIDGEQYKFEIYSNRYHKDVVVFKKINDNYVRICNKEYEMHPEVDEIAKKILFE